MAIITGENANADDFINESERSVDPTDDEGKVVKLEADGKIDGAFLRTPQILTFTSSGTWTKDAGLKYVIVEVQGAGGRGDSCGGGGSGAYSRKTILASALGATESITIGAASVGSGNTSFGTHVTCGNGGNASGDTGGSAGTASGGDFNLNGQAGQEGFGSLGGGAGGSSFLGFGGPYTAPGNATNTRGGLSGSGFGAGGAGNADATDGSPDASGGGGNGTAGVVIVTEYY